MSKVQGSLCVYQPVLQKGKSVSAAMQAATAIRTVRALGADA